MSVLIDTGVLHAFLNTRDRQHPKARAFMDSALDGAHGQMLASPFILDEAATLALARGQTFQAVESLFALAGLIPDADLPPLLRIVELTAQDLEPCYRLQKRHWDRRLSFTDCTNLHLMAREKIGLLATFDGRFQGLVPVVPSDAS